LIYYLLDGNEHNSVTADSATADSTIFIGLSGLEAIEGGITKAFLPKIESITFKIVRIFIQIIQIKYVENYKIIKLKEITYKINSIKFAFSMNYL